MKERIVPVKSEQDEREYVYLVLENQMKVLLVSDPTTTKSAANMEVRVGSHSDPTDIPGLAHFLEHMLFLGTTKYPEEDSYAKFIQNHGGSENAGTGAESTNYYFDVSSVDFKEALDRFAQFFISPLFTESATEREMKAVDSEHSRNLQVDSRRLNAVLNTLCRSDHPLSKFSTGNLETLSTAPNIRERLLAFYKEFYSSSVMTLAVYGKEPLDILECWVREIFSEVPNTQRTPPMIPPSPFPKQNLPVECKIVSVKHNPRLYLFWPLDRCYKYLYWENPEYYVSHLLGHEGYGSVLSLLRKLELATKLLAGSYKHASSYSIFYCRITLTHAGFVRRQEVANIVYQYLQLQRDTLGASTQWIFQEQKQISEMTFRFKQKARPVQYVQDLVHDLHWYKPEHVLIGDFLMENFNVDLIRELLDQLVPHNTIVLVRSREFEGTTDLQEKWLKVPYSKNSIDERVLEEWRNAKPNKDELFLRSPNPFIATDFTLKTTHDPDDESFPKALVSNQALRGWFLEDKRFRQPRGHVLLLLHSPVVYVSPRTMVTTQLLTTLLGIQLNEVLYDASECGLDVELLPHPCGLLASFNGYHHKLPLLIQTVLEYVMKFKADPAHFAVTKEKVTSQIKNTKMGQPVQWASEEVTSLVRATRWRVDENLAVIGGIRKEEVEGMIKQILGAAHVECFVAGNFLEEDGRKIMEMVVNTLKITPILPSQIPHLRVLQLNTDVDYLLQEVGPNTENANSAIVNYHQVGVETPRLKALTSTLVEILSEPFFNQLRTQEQLGYVVSCNSFLIGNVYAIRLIIQSAFRDPPFLDTRIQSFLTSFRENIVTMSEEEFRTSVGSVVTRKEEKPHKLAEHVSKLWSVIYQHQAKFELEKLEIQYLKEKITREEVLQFFDEILLGVNRGGKLSVQIFGNAHPLPSSSSNGDAKVSQPKRPTITIGEFYQFKEKMFIYPLEPLQH